MIVQAHPQLRDGWSMPSSPLLYPKACAYRQGDKWELDFFNEQTCAFAAMSNAFPWPWKEGFKPAAADWKKIGFKPLW